MPYYGSQLYEALIFWAVMAPSTISVHQLMLYSVLFMFRKKATTQQDLNSYKKLSGGNEQEFCNNIKKSKTTMLRQEGMFLNLAKTCSFFQHIFYGDSLVKSCFSNTNRTLKTRPKLKLVWILFYFFFCSYTY